MSASSRWLREREWSMGNGQCVACHGIGPSFLRHGFPGREAADLGHERDCSIALAMVADGEEDVLFKGDMA